jgi:hypothetical protein
MDTLHTTDTTSAKLERLRPTRLIRHDQKITNYTCKTSIEDNKLISILPPTLSIINHVISQVKLINMRRFASYSKHAKVIKQ